MATPAARAAHDSDAVDLIAASRKRVGTRLVGRDLLVSLTIAITFLAAAVPLAILAPTERSPSPIVLALLVAAYAFASRIHFEIGIGFALPTQVVFVPMLFLVPPAIAPLLVAGGFLLAALPKYLQGGWHFERSVVLLGSGWHAVGPALVLVLAGEPSPDWRAHWPVFVVALGAQFAFDFAAATARALALGVAIRPQLGAAGVAYAVDAALAPLGLVVAYAATDGHEYAFLLAAPLLGLIGFFARERRARIDHAVELGQAYRGTALLLGDVVEADDAYTGTHSRHVVDLVLAVCDRMNVPARDRRRAEFTALLHDVGKIRVPASILNKPGPLDPNEWALMERHTIEGERMLEQVGGLLGEVGHIVRSCHERWDGMGYPDHLAGDAIPLVARIVCCCDAYSAMTTDRPYRAARTTAEALAELRRCSGSQFDPAVVDALALSVC